MRRCARTPPRGNVTRVKPPRRAVTAVTLALLVSPGLSAAQVVAGAPPSAGAQDIERRLLALEQDNARLRGEIEALREELLRQPIIPPSV